MGGRSDALVTAVAGDASLRIRPMTLADLPAVVAIERDSFARPWSLASFHRELSLPWSIMEVAYEQGVGGAPVVGYVCRWTVADEIHVMNVAVHPRCRRRGIGSWLVTRVLDAATGAGARSVLLEVRSGNTGARRLYAQAGFRQVGLRRSYYGPGQDALVLQYAVSRSP